MTSFFEESFLLHCIVCCFGGVDDMVTFCFVAIARFLTYDFFGGNIIYGLAVIVGNESVIGVLEMRLI